jgi:hypothetical protein
MISTNPIPLVFHNIHEHGVEIIDRWIAEVEKRTKNVVRFTKTTGEDAKLIAAADVVRDVPAADPRYALLGLVQVPFIFPDAAVGSRVIAQLYEEFSTLREELNDNKVVGLSIGAPMAIFSTKAWGPIKSIENLKSARIRSLPVIDGPLRALGALPVHVPYLEIRHLLETGKLDATVLGVLPGYMFHLAESAAPYCTVTGGASITMHPMRVYMKWECWNRLPVDIQRIIDGLGPSGRDCWFAVQSGLDADMQLVPALEYVRRYGELITLVPEELERWRSLVKPEIDSMLHNLEARALPAGQFYRRMLELTDAF